MPTTTGKATDFITFSRASLATVTDSDGKIKWAPHNLLLASEQFDASAWTKNAVTVAANSVAAPNGTTTADTATETAATDLHVAFQSVDLIAGGVTYTFTVFAKANTRTHAMLRIGGGSFGTGPAIRASLSGSGSVTTLAGTVASSSISLVGDGWYLISMTFASGSVATHLPQCGPHDGGSATTYTGDITKSVYLWGAHLYRSDLGGMVANTSAYPMYNPTTPKNLLGFTEAFDNAAWTKTAVTVTANAAIAPNGLQTADLMSGDGTSSSHRVEATVSPVPSTKVYSFYAKVATVSFVQLNVSGDSSGWVNFDIANGTLSNQGTGYTGAISNAGDGWYRCSVTTSVAAAANPRIQLVTSLSAVLRETNTISGGIYLWGAQVSDSASLDPYVANAFAAPTAAAYHGPRLDFDPVSLAAKGLLVEEQRTNILNYSSEIDNATGWGNFGTTVVTANAATAPDGTMSADLVEIASSGNGRNHELISVSASTAYTASLFVKANAGTQFNFILNYFDSGLNYLSQTTATVTISAGTSCGNGWYRHTLTGTTPVGGVYIQFRITSVTNNNSFYLWGAQLEAGAFATSYIPTGASTVTRSADVASVATSAFPYSSTEGTYVASFQTLFSGTSAASSIVLSADGSLSKRIAQIAAATDVVSTLDASGTISATGDVTGAVAKVGSAYDASNRYIVANGGTVASGTIAAGYGTASSTVIGGVTGSNYLNGHIRQITYIPRRLSNAELQARTA